MNAKPGIRGNGLLPLVVALVVVLVGTACRDSGRSAGGDAPAPAALSAQTLPLGPEFLVKAQAGKPAVAMDRSGRFLVLWPAEDADGPGIFGQRFDASGARSGPEFRLDTDTAQSLDAQERPSVAMDADGNFVVAWSSSDGDGYGVVAQSFGADGAARGRAFTVNSNIAGDQFGPSVAIDAAGNFIIAWTSRAQGRSGIFAQRYYAAGSRLGVEFRADAGEADSAQNPTVAMDPSGGQLVVWEAEAAEGAGFEILGQRFDFHGNRAGGSFRPVPGTGAALRFPGVAMDAAGNFLVTWADGDDFLVAVDGIFVRRYSASGAAWSADLRINDEMWRAHAPRLATDAAGNFVVVWEGGHAEDQQAVFARQFRSGGASVAVSTGVNAGAVAGADGSSGAAAAGILAWGADGIPLEEQPAFAGFVPAMAKASITTIPERLYMAPALTDVPGDFPDYLPAAQSAALLTYIASPFFPIGILKFDGSLDVISATPRTITVNAEPSMAADCQTDENPPSISGCSKLELVASSGGLFAGDATMVTPLVYQLEGGAILDNFTDPEYENNTLGTLRIYGTTAQLNTVLQKLTYKPLDGYVYNGSNGVTITVKVASPGDPEISDVIDIRVLGFNDFPQLTPSLLRGDPPPPTEVATPNQEITVNPSGYTVTDEDVNAGDERDMLLIGWLDCSQPVAANRGFRFAGGGATFKKVGGTIEELLEEVLPGNPAAVEVVLAGLDFVAPELKDLQYAINQGVLTDAFGAVGEITAVQNALAILEFRHNAANDDCTLTTVVSDLGHWGLPLQYLGADIEIPLLGFDYNQKVFQTGRTASVTGGTVTEGNTGTKTFDVTVALGAPAIGTETLTLSTMSGTATGGASCTAGIDYVTLTGEAVIFTAGQASRTVPVTICGDAVLEPDETFTVTLGNAQNVEINDGDDSVTISNDDTAPTVTLSVMPASISETGGTSIVTATLAQPTTQEVTVMLAVSGTAAAGDYDLPLNIVIPANSTTQDVTLTAQPDMTDEADETVVIAIDDVINAIESGMQQQTVTITDDDDAPTVTLSVAPDSIAENAGTSMVTATLSQPSGQEVKVTLMTAGQATAGDDYMLPLEITIPIGNPSGSVTLTAAPDTIDEPDEAVIVDISGVTNGTESGDQQETVTITDDDDAPTVTLDVSPASIAENAGTSTVTATLLQPSGQEVTVALMAAGVATAGDDYMLPLEITIPIGNPSGSVTLTAVQDTIDEPNETVIIDISGVTNATESGDQQETVTITDDDEGPVVTLSVTSASVMEAGGTSTVTATLDVSSPQPVTVNLTLTGTATSATDYMLLSTIVIPANTMSESITLTALQDAIDEPNETVVIDITGVTNATELNTQQRTVTITDDDATPTVTLNVTPSSVAEAGGTSMVTAMLDVASSQPVTVDLTLTGTATSATDYMLLSTIVIPANTMSESITLTVQQDTFDEPDETVVIDITGVDNATEFNTQQQTVTITDDDATPTVTLNVTPSSVAEAGGTSMVTAMLDVASSQPVTVDLTLTGTATSATDYMLLSTIVIPANAMSESVTLTAQQDTIDELDETVVIDITGVTNASEFNTQQQTVTITDDDATPNVTLVVQPASVAEAAGTSIVTVTLDRASSRQVTVNLGRTGTATLGGDYTLDGNIMIPANGTFGSITLTAVQDAIDEPDETVVIDVTGVTNADESVAQQQSVTIVDDDAKSVSVAVGSSAEGNAGMTVVNATVTLSTPAIGNETVSLSTMDGTATGGMACADGIDYVAVSAASVSFAAGETSQQVPVTICGDIAIEGNETFSVVLSNAANVSLGTATATSTIGNDDVPPPTVPPTAPPTTPPTTPPTAPPSTPPTTPPSTPPTVAPTAGPETPPTPPAGGTSTPTPTPPTSPGPTPTPTPGVSPSPTETPSPTAGSINSGEGWFGGSFDPLSLFAGLLLLLARRGRKVLAVLVAAVLLPTLARAETNAEVTARINLREQAGKDVQVVTVLEAGQAVKVLERGPQFSRVASTVVRSGYMPLLYLKPCDSDAPPECALTTTVVNVREGKGIEHTLVGRLQPDARVVVEERDDEYARIRHQVVITGYVPTDALRELDPPAALAPPPEPAPETSPVPASPPPATDVSGSSPPRSVERRPGRYAGWRLGASLGSALSTLDRAEVQRRFTDAGVAAEILSYDAQDVALELFAHYDFTPAWGLQISYFDLGELKTRFNAEPEEAEALVEAARDEYPIAGDGFVLAATGQTGSGAWRLSASLGAFLALNRDIEISLGDQALTTEGPGVAALVGVGAGYILAHRWQVHADVRALDLNGWIVVPTLGVSYGFE